MNGGRAEKSTAATMWPTADARATGATVSTLRRNCRRRRPGSRGADAAVANLLLLARRRRRPRGPRYSWLQRRLWSEVEGEGYIGRAQLAD